MKIFEIPIYYRTYEEFAKDRHWRCYHYNEVIGWIALYPRFQTIRAEYWFIRQRPIKTLTKKEFECKGKLFQINVTNFNNEKILSKLLATISEFQTSGELSKFYFDVETLVNTGKHIDWKAILSQRT